MDNTRYGSRSLDRATVVIAVVGLAVLVVNALRITGVLPDLAALRTLAPLGALSGALVLGLLTQAAARRTGSGWATATGLVATVGVMGLAAIEFITNYVFPSLEEAAIAGVLDGRTMTMFVVTSMTFLVAAVAFAIVLGVTKAFPVVPVVVFALGSALLALRSFLPVPVVAVGLVALGAGVLWLGLEQRRLGADLQPTAATA